MPLSQNPIVEWPTEVQHLLRGLEIVPARMASAMAGSTWM